MLFDYDDSVIKKIGSYFTRLKIKILFFIISGVSTYRVVVFLDSFWIRGQKVRIYLDSMRYEKVRSINLN